MYPASVARSRGRQGSPGGASAGHGGKDWLGDAFEEEVAFDDDADVDAADDAGENPPPPPPTPLPPSPLATRASASATSAVVSLAREDDLCLLLMAAVEAAAGRDEAAALRARSIDIFRERCLRLLRKIKLCSRLHLDRRKGNLSTFFFFFHSLSLLSMYSCLHGFSSPSSSYYWS